MASSLRAELLAIEGIAAAELEGTEDAPQGVRVQLAAGANAEVVGVEVERVLANHGMKSHLAGEQDSLQPDRQPSREAGGPPPPPGAGGDAAILPMRAVVEPDIETATELVEAVERAFPALESVAVEESKDGIAVRVMVGGQAVTRQVGSGPDGMEAAIVSALSQALDIEADHISTQRVDAADVKIVTVLLEVAGLGQQVGSSVVSAGEAYSMAKAAWKALTTQA